MTVNKTKHAIKKAKTSSKSEVDSRPKYKLTLNEKQLELISLALDIFSRLQNGQIEWCFSMIPWKHYENLKAIEPLLNQIKESLTGMTNGHLGIGNVSEPARIAYDLHQVIRYSLQCENKQQGDEPKHGFYNPTQYGNELLATLEKKET